MYRCSGRAGVRVRSERGPRRRAVCVRDGDAGDQEDEGVGEVAQRLPELVQEVEDFG